MGSDGAAVSTELPSVSCAIMAFNEEEMLERATADVRTSLLKLGRPFEIIIVDDGSTDGTAEIARELEARWSEVRLVQHGANRGPGSAIVTGIAEARCDLFCFHPADNQLVFDDVARALPELDEQYDLLVGERSDRHDYSLLRRVYSYGYIGLAWGLFGLRGFSDFNFVYAFRRDLFEKVEIQTSGLFLCTEILIKAVDQGCRAGIMRARYLPRTTGVSTVGRPSVAVDTLRQMLSFWWRYRFG